MVIQLEDTSLTINGKPMDIKHKPYYGCIIYGPYLRKDGRKHMIAKDACGDKQITISYPKYLMEIHLGRYLEEDETVHHKDENIHNNKLNNLEVIGRREHNRSHMT